MTKITKENIFEEAKKGNLEVLDSPYVTIERDFFGRTPLNHIAYNCPDKVLNDTRFKNDFEKIRMPVEKRTIFHDLAIRGIKAPILDNPLSVNFINILGDTPLHDVAWNIGNSVVHGHNSRNENVKIIKDILSYPNIHNLKNNKKESPVDILFGWGVFNLNKDILPETFPWYFKNKILNKITKKDIACIYNTPNSYKFINN